MNVFSDKHSFVGPCIREAGAEVVKIREKLVYISLVPFADQIAVLKKADVFLSHCGMNSVNESLYFGVPMILHPQTAEQEGVAGPNISEIQSQAGVWTGQGLWGSVIVTFVPIPCLLSTFNP